MRWDRLFDDLEGQLEQELSADELDERAEEERLRLGRLSLRDRILAVHAAAEGDPDATITVVLAGGDTVALRPTTFGRDWFAAVIVEGAGGRAHGIVPIAAIAGLILSSAQIEQSLAGGTGQEAEHSLSARLTLTFVLRDLCRRRAAIEVRTTTGRLRGTIDRVGRDHLDLAVHDVGEPRRSRAVVQYRVVPFAQLSFVRF